MITYELAKQLKDAGFLTRDLGNGYKIYSSENMPFVPTLSELIEACGVDDDFTLHRIEGIWISEKWYKTPLGIKMLKAGQHKGSTPEEAVARLWIKLNKK